MRKLFSQALFPILFFAWAFAIFRNYFPTVGWTTVSQALQELFNGVTFALRYLEPTPWPDVTTGILFFAFAGAVGSHIVPWLRPTIDTEVERLLLAFTLGLGATSYATFVLSLVGLLSQRLFWGILLATLIVSHGWLRKTLRLFADSIRSLNLSRMEKALGAYVAFHLVIIGLSSLAPVTTFDTVVYHLTGPKIYGEQHRLVPIPDILETVFPKNVEMIYLFALKLHYEITAQFVGFLMGVLLCGWILYLGAKHFSRLTALVALAIFISIPIVGFELRSTYIDFVIALFVPVGLHYALKWKGTQHRWDLLTSAILVGFAAGAKYNALIHVFLIGVALWWWARRIKPAAIFVAIALLGTSHWLVICYLQTGDPMFPFFSGDPLIPGFQPFDDGYWKRYNPVVAGSATYRWGLPLSLGNVARTFWGMHFDNWRFDGNLGPLIILLFPFFLLGNSTYRGYVAAYLVFWLISAQSNRYMIPVLPMASLATASGIMTMRQTRALFAVVTAAFALLMLPVFYDWWHSPPQYHPSIVKQIPWKLFLGWNLKNDYLRRTLWSYPAIQHVNSLKPSGKVLYVGYHDGPPLFYMEFPYIYNGLAAYHAILDANTVDKGLAELGRHDVEYLIVEKFWGRRHFITRKDSPFHAYLEPVFDWNAASVYRLRSSPVEAPRLVDLVTRTESDPHLIVSLLADEYRIGIRTSPSSHVDYRMTILPAARLHFSLNLIDQSWKGYARATIGVPGKDGQMREIYSTAIDRSIPDRVVSWKSGEVDLSTWAGQAITLRFSSPDTDIVWAEPQIR